MPQNDLDRLLPSLVAIPPGPVQPQSEGGFRFFATDDLVLQVDPTDFVWIGAGTFNAVRALYPFVDNRWVIEGSPEAGDSETLAVQVIRAGQVVGESRMRLATDGTLREWSAMGEPMQLLPGDKVRTEQSQNSPAAGSAMRLTSIQTTPDGRIAALIEGDPWVRGR
jgi:hypothetical protein